MKFLVAILAVILTATLVLAQSSGSDAAATGITGLIGMFGVFGFFLALVYSILLSSSCPSWSGGASGD
jgi:hypothetical protein